MNNEHKLDLHADTSVRTCHSFMQKEPIPFPQGTGTAELHPVNYGELTFEDFTTLDNNAISRLKHYSDFHGNTLLVSALNMIEDLLSANNVTTEMQINDHIDNPGGCSFPCDPFDYEEAIYIDDFDYQEAVDGCTYLDDFGQNSSPTHDFDPVIVDNLDSAESSAPITGTMPVPDNDLLIVHLSAQLDAAKVEINDLTKKLASANSDISLVIADNLQGDQTLSDTLAKLSHATLAHEAQKSALTMEISQLKSDLVAAKHKLKHSGAPNLIQEQEVSLQTPGLLGMHTQAPSSNSAFDPVGEPSALLSIPVLPIALPDITEKRVIMLYRAFLCLHQPANSAYPGISSIPVACRRILASAEAASKGIITRKTPISATFLCRHIDSLRSARECRVKVLELTRACPNI